jgi:hypothetical protein
MDKHAAIKLSSLDSLGNLAKKTWRTLLYFGE